MEAINAVESRLGGKKRTTKVLFGLVIGIIIKVKKNAQWGQSMVGFYAYAIRLFRY